MTEQDPDWDLLETDLPIPKTEAEYAARMHAEALLRVMKEQQKHIDNLERAVKKINDERESMLKWGVMTLGGAVLMLGGYIWHIVADKVIK